MGFNLEKIFKQIDVYGQEIKLNFYQRNKYNTVFGGVISLTIFCLFCVGCWFFGKELIYKQSPSVISSERPVDCPKRIDIRPDNLILMMGVSNFQGQYFTDPSLFQVRAIQQTQIAQYDQTTGNRTIQLINTPKKIRICNQNDVGILNLKKYFSTINIGAQYCFDTKDDEVYIEGDFNQEKYSQLFVFFEKCKNSTSSQIICKSKEEIDKNLANNRISLFASDHVINPLDFLNPISDRGINLVSVTSSQFPQQATFYFTNYYIQTDAGVFYEDIQTQNSFIFTSQVVSPFFGDPDVIIAMNFRMQKQKESYMQRKYLKIADVIAQIGGLLKILLIVGFIISNPITKIYYLKAIIDEVYQFQIIDDKTIMSQRHSNLSINSKKKQDTNLNPKNKLEKEQLNQQLELFSNQNDNNSQSKKKKEDEIQLKKIQQETQITQQNLNSITPNSPNKILKSFVQQNQFQNQQQTQISNNKNFIDQILSSAKNYFQSTHSKIKYKFNHYFAHAFMPNANFIYKRRQLLDQGINKINQNFDILYIFNKLHEIDKLKQILLNKNQLKLFDYMPKPLISDGQLQIENKQIQDNYQSNCLNKNESPQMLIKEKENYKTESKNNKQNIQNDNRNNQKVNNQNNENEFSEKSQESSQSRQFNQQNQSCETLIAQEAYSGLINILNQNKLSKIDENLIKIIDPNIFQEFYEKNAQQTQLQSFLLEQKQKFLI
ncbi:transmembrane protein, putative (macronuclear) [Tetrahymena thermophila SB210]|uniref:Transmembrane protein, putative n=1 Tax=Tetrahymena thermophila (strain SB210) TaxID=312017 RepID=Q22M02_TETTS|nr:transmembrane protein, putative [Tetrahymena thermophila SB210]EAR86247.2 transmembrane protein, putative [Tetrahymena thermophila SB210]|eukprot:XP_977218.2 transmembrane protein, putative [Tetrahymena thermophila SB210]